MIELLLSIPNGYWIFGLVIASFYSGTVFSGSLENENRLEKGLSVLLLIGFVIMVIATYPLITG